MRIVVLCLLFAAPGALADSSVAAGDAALGAECSFEDGPHWKRRSAIMLGPCAERRVGCDEPRIKNVAPFGNLQHAAGGHLLFTRDWHKGGSALVTASDMHVIWEWQRHLTALAIDGERLIGEVQLERLGSGTTEINFYEPISDKKRWTVQGLHRGDDSAATLVDGNQLILATFHRIATGSHLVSVDVRTGTPRWIADVEQVNASHSEYFNDVSLERRGTTVVMRGYEASGCYVQVFDLATGRRISSQMKRAW